MWTKTQRPNMPQWPVALPLAAVLLALPAATVSAQDAGTLEKPAAAEKKSEAKNPAEKVQVTGSRIKRTEVETSAPTTIISREQIESTGVATVAELLRKQSSASTGNFDGNVGFVRGGASTGNLFGLGSGRTLVLLDGERLPKDASLSGTNLSLIPASMIERVEILSGSRSAVYGSDAIAGVINIITRQDFSGSEVKTSVRAPQNGGGERLEINASTGFQAGPARIVLAASGAKENRIIRANRDISPGEGKYGNSTAWAPAGTYSWRPLDPGTYLANGEKTWRPSDNCPSENRTDLDAPAAANSTSNGVFCVGSIKENSPAELLPAYEKRSLSSKLDWDIGTASKLTAFAMVSDNTSKNNQGPTLTVPFNSISNRYLMLNPELAQQLIPGLAADQAVEVRARVFDAPDRFSENRDLGYGGFVSFNTEVGEKTALNVAVNSFTSTNQRQRSNVPNRDDYNKLFFPDDRKPGFIALRAGDDPALVENITTNLEAREVNRATSASVNISQALASLQGGDLTASFGIDVRKETFDQTPDSRDTLFSNVAASLPLYTGTEGIAGNGKRDVSSFYTELNAPVTKDLQFDAAARQDQYNDFGKASTYNVGAKYNLARSVTLRTSAGSSFRAPELNYIYQVGGGGYEDITDQKRCDYLNSTGVKCENPVFNIFVDRPGNRDMKPEVGKSYTIGAIIEPNEHIYLSADYGGFAISNVFNRRSADEVAKDFYANKGTGASKLKFSAPDQGDYIDSAAVPWENIGQELTYVVQGEAAFSYKVNSVGLNYKSSGTRTLSRKSEEIDGTMFQQNGLEGAPKWRWNNAFTSRYSEVAWNLNSSTISKQVPNPKNLETYRSFDYNDSVPEFTQFDTSFDWNFIKTGKVTLGVLNLADKIGGLYRSGNYTGAEDSNGSLYASSWYGRTYFANLTQTF